jgi:cytochrome c
MAMLGDRKLERKIDVARRRVALVGDAASVERGGYLYRSRGCGDCHGLDGAGKVVVETAGC